jgi:hypothetical protein
LVLVLSACGGAHRVPEGVSEIDIRASVRQLTRPPSLPYIFSRRITDPSQVKRIIGWFNSLKRPGRGAVVCGGGYDANVTLTFRSPDGAALEIAHSPPARAGICDPIHLTIFGHHETVLVDSNQGMSLIDRFKRLLGRRFRPVGVYLG